MGNPLVSVVMPVYNAEKFIGTSIESVLNQSYAELELIIIDDCSTDASLKVIEQFHDERIKIYHNICNKGVSYSRNSGMDVSRGKYIAMLDDDDISEVKRLEKQIQFMENHSDIDAVGCRVSVIDEQGNFLSYWNREALYNPKYIRACMLMYNVYINSAMLYKSDVIRENNLKFQENAIGMEDYIFLADFSRVGNISGVNEPLVSYRVHTSNTTDVIRTTKMEERKRKWREVHIDILKKAGFKLKQKQYDVLLKAFNDDTWWTVTISADEKQEIKDTLEEMVVQAENMGVDNVKEFVQWTEFVKRRNGIV